MKNISFIFFDKWWKPLISSIIILALCIVFENNETIVKLLIAVCICILIGSVIFQFKKNWKSGLVTIFVYYGFVCFLFFIYFIYISFFIDMAHPYSDRYENRKEIQNIIGVKIPKFEVISSDLVHIKDFDFEFETQCIIEFKNMPDDKFYQTLDDICELPIPTPVDENSSFFYYGLESTDRCWSKNGNEYRYCRDTDFGEKFLHSKDAYFYFTITKGSKTAKITYGNY
jgi:energy-coupling factor transporter transmembrane protein EcfT